MTEKIVFAIFTAAYIISFLVSRIGMYAASGLLLIFAAVFVYVYENRRTSEFLCLRGLFVLGFIGGEGISCFKLSKLQHDWTITSWVSFYLAFAVFFIVYGLVSRRCSDSKRATLASSSSSASCLQKMVWGLLIISISSFIIEAVVLGYIPFFVKDTPHAYSYFHIKGLHYITTLVVLIPSVTILYLNVKRKLDVTSLAGLVLPLIVTIFLVSRFQFLFAVILALFTAAFTGAKYSVKQIAVIVICMILVYVIITIQRAHSVQYLNGIFEMKNPAMPIFITQPYIYIANNYDNFNAMTENLTVHSMGLKMLYPFLTLSGAKFLLHIPMDFPAFVTKEELTTLTVIYDAFYDFGVIGVALFSAILGLACAITEHLMKTLKNPMMCMISAQLAFYLAFSFFTTWFSNPASWFYLFVSLIMFILYEITSRRVRS